MLNDSLLALLFYPLRGWERYEIYVEGAQTLQKLAGSLLGSLETDKGQYKIDKHKSVAKGESKGKSNGGGSSMGPESYKST